MTDLATGAAWSHALSGVRVVIFDLWQTLANAQVRPLDLFNRHLRELRVCSDTEFLRQLSLSDVFLRDVPLEVSIQDLFGRLGVANATALARCVSAWKTMAEGVYLYDGAAGLLDLLKRRHYQLCLLTNTDKVGFDCLQARSRLALFDFYFLSYQQGYAKPDKRCWEAIRKHFGIDYSKMLMVGDSTNQDITPAKMLGLQTIQVGGGASDIATLADIIRNYSVR